MRHRCDVYCASQCNEVEIYIVERFTEDGVVTFETTVSIFQDSIQTLSLSGSGEDTKHVHNDNRLAYTDIASFVKEAP